MAAVSHAHAATGLKDARARCSCYPAPVRQRQTAAMKVSIVVPALDEAGAITATLAALQPLRVQGHEVVVVDGGSRDATLLIAKLLADRALAAPAGRASQMNAGARHTDGDVLLFLHADTLLPPGAVAAMRAAIDRGAAWGRFDVAFRGHAAILKVVAFMMNLRSRLTGIATGDQAMFVTRAAFERIGGFPPIALMEDIALSAALKRHAGTPACLRQKVETSGRRFDTHGPWRTIFRMWRLRAAYALGADPAHLARQYR